MVNVTPTRVSADIPLIGSFSAFPMIRALEVMSLPVFADRSATVLVACVKMSFPLPASFLTFRNVSSMLSPAFTATPWIPE